MRMNRGTVFLIAALLVVIAVVLLINNNQASAPGTTPTPNTATGPLFAGMIPDNVVRYEVRDNTTGSFTALTRDTGGAWHIDGTNTLAHRDPDQTLIATTAGQITGINYNNTFVDDKLDTFGLNAPQYSVLVTTSDGSLYTIHVGAKTPTSSRYYAVVEQAAAPAATSEPAGAIATENVSGENANEEGVLPATAEATAEATTAPASKRVFQTATEEATAEVTALAADLTPEATVAASSEATAEATAGATAEATAEATANVIQGAGITLSGSQTIYVIPQTVIDTLKRWLTTPPYAPLPTAAPTLEAFTPEATVEATEAPTAEATSAATEAPTAEVTAEATAAQ